MCIFHAFSVYICCMMQCLNSFNMYICKYKYNLDITITLSLICSYIHGFVWYFELFTIYTSLSWIYVVSHYFKASSKMLKSSIIHCRVHVPPSLVPSYSVGRKKAMWFCLFVCLFVCLFICLFVWSFSSHSRIFHSFGDVIFAGEGP